MKVLLFHAVVLLSVQPEMYTLDRERLDVRSLLSDRLTEVIESRTAKTSEVEWSLSRHGGRDDGLVEHFTTRTAGASIIQSNRGDAQGFHELSFLRQPPGDASPDVLREYASPRERSAGTRITLAHEGLVWELPQAEHPLSGRVTSASTVIEAQERPRDMAAAGLAPFWADHFNTVPLGLPEHRLAGFESAEWSQQRSGRFEIVTAEFNGSRLEWMLDSHQGGAPVRAALYLGDDRLVYASETDLAEVDGRWMPTSISFYRGDADAPYRVVDVQEATFDKPWHAKEITPDDMGFLFGTQMHGDGIHFWSGADLLSLDEYYELLYVYGVRPDQKIMEMLSKKFGQTVEEYVADIDRQMPSRRDKYYQKHGEAPWLSVTSKEKDEWDEYVEKFIKKHKFDEPRIKRAHDMLERAKKLRDIYLRKHVSDIRRAERRRDTQKLAVFDAHTKRVFETVLVRMLKRMIPKKPTPKAVARSDN